ncbi:MAG: acyl-CoA dehydrogenase [Nitrospira sp.]|nr:acyl-CoA dehydrogenase [Candidatus Manganitrophaceae bacterium]HIL35696.1 acyl-CoA dehydrogenase [Candidatus Manganitrophaceae bacterium]
MVFTTLRRNILTRPIFRWARKALPSLSETEREALESGDVWWDGELFTGDPDWQKLLDTPPSKLSEKEQAFQDGPVEELCGMLNEWEFNHVILGLPEQVWDFMRKNKFFAIIIPEAFGGLEFSAYGHSEVIRKIGSRSLVAAVTVMVPNSLGPGELLMQFGTKKQQDYWLPRLAKGDEIPCFGLTSPTAGSDAASLHDNGIVCKSTFEGKKVTGIRLNWHKRYTTLGPVATVLGLAFKLYDPEHILGEQNDLGITVALVPTDLKGIEIGRRHLPAGQMFQVGPNWGKDVFIPMDYIIGGEAQIGKGWKMLMMALAAGRGISLPSLSASSIAFSARTTGAYAQIRKQFGIPIGKFGGIQTLLGRMAASAYLVDAARKLTCAGLDEGYKLAVISAIMKAHATSRMRDSVIDAMDVHAGKAVMDGPLNYIGQRYKALPVAITVEGANVLTRSMIIFGQGAIRCHPWLLKEMTALDEKDKARALADFDKALWGHVGHGFRTLGRAWLWSLSKALIVPAPLVPDAVRPYYKNLSRYAAGFALLSDIAFLTLGGTLKRREMLSGRLGDILSELYLLSAVLKRWEDDGRKEEDLPLVAYCMEDGFTTIEARTAAILKNLPSRPFAWLVRLITQPFGPRNYGPSDDLIKQCAGILLESSETRDRLTGGLYFGNEGDPVHTLEKAFVGVQETRSLREKMHKANIDDVEEAQQKGILTDNEAEKLQETNEAIEKTIAVDDFAPEDLVGLKGHQDT